jgi:polyhydroxyalkanoate synthesis regulator phasin
MTNNIETRDAIIKAARLDATESEVERLEAEVERLKKRVESQTDWYQQRFDTLRVWVNNEVKPLSEEVAHRYFSICANGSPAPHEDGEWKDTLHVLRFERDKWKSAAESQNKQWAARCEEVTELRAEVERLKGILQRKGYREACSIPACNCGEHSWNHGEHADERLREIRDALDDDCQGKTLLGAVTALKSYTWQQERAAVVAMLTNPNAPLRSSTHYAGKIERGEHWPKGGEG